MTAVEPLPVRETALLCAASHPLAPEILCARFPHGREVLHSSDGSEQWLDAPPPAGLRSPRPPQRQENHQ